MDKKFEIEYKTLISLLVRAKWRKPKRLAGLTALIVPIITLYNLFISFLLSKLYELSKTSQVVYIEAVLNDRWDSNFRRIEVVDYASLEPHSIYRKPESKAPLYVYRKPEAITRYVYRNTEINAIAYDFVIQIPVSIVYDIEELKALVNKYKLYGKAYIIQQV